LIFNIIICSDLQQKQQLIILAGGLVAKREISYPAIEGIYNLNQYPHWIGPLVITNVIKKNYPLTNLINFQSTVQPISWPAGR